MQPRKRAQKPAQWVARCTVTWRLSDEVDEQAYRDYRQAIRALPVLSTEEERALAARMRAGMRPAWQVGPWLTPDAYAARQRLIEGNLCLALAWAHTWRPAPGLTYWDLIQTANLALAHAVDRFDPDVSEAGVAALAAYLVHHALACLHSTTVGPFRLPEQVARSRRKVLAYVRRCEESGRTPEEDEVLAATGVRPAHLTLVQGRGHMEQVPLSLDVPTEDGEVLADELAQTEPDPAQDGAWTAGLADLDRALATLTARERRVMQLRYGLSGGEPLRSPAIGKALRLAPLEVLDVETRAIEKLRRALRPRPAWAAPQPVARVAACHRAGARVAVAV